MNRQTSEDAIVQNLRDAGCDRDTIAAFLEELRTHRLQEGLKRLAVHRRSLLEELHKEQKQLDCLDYLVYTLQRSKSPGQSERSHGNAYRYKSNL